MFRSHFRRRRPVVSGSHPELVANPHNQIGGAHEFVAVPQDEALMVNGSPVQIEANEYRIDGNAKN
ncbi:hypothetical protein [Sphingopyxis sp. 113P3]|jgi:hypothetical protein|uniref:hypothetical protein n=1 Tax=Sphingopyxis sp. (strain 113P3) TaxID=292913 RepID=UPI0006AD597C|nr:hypothetical protein [Sphingopyxis sp. 113P3]ALC10836.1 hypothetical protein LH20_02605 [Sphingopyxis sp. 113P3]